MQNDDIFIPKLTKRITFKERHYNQPVISCISLRMFEKTMLTLAPSTALNTQRQIGLTAKTACRCYFSINIVKLRTCEVTTKCSDNFELLPRGKC